MSNNKEWNDLSMRERASYIRKAVFRGLSNIDDIREDYRLFGGGGDTLQENPIYKVLPKLLLEAGLDIRVSSGYRPIGKAGNAGKKSWHWRHGAVDIVPLGKTTFEDIEDVIYNNPKVKLYLLSHNFGLLDETGRSKESKAIVLKTGATGPHFHFGRDTNAVNSYRARVGALQGGDRGKVVYFTNPDIPLEPLVPLVSRDNALVIPALPRVSPEEVLANISIPEPIYINDDKELDIAMEDTIPEIEVIGQPKTPNPLTILSLIQEVQPAPYVMEPYLIPIKLNTVGDLAAERDTLLQKDLEDRIISEERRRRLGYSYRDDNIEDDIKLMLFLRNMNANGGILYGEGGDTENRYDANEDVYDAGSFPTIYVTPYGNFNATQYPWLSALLARSQLYDEVNPLLGDNETPITLRSIINGKPGRLNTAVIAPEWITRAALAAQSKGYNPALPIALMSRESTLGNDTDGPTTAKLWSKENIEELRKLGVDPYKTELHIGLPFRLSELRKQVRLNNIGEYPYVLPNLSYRYNTMIGNHDFYDDKFPYYRMYDEAINNVGLDRAAINEWLSQNYKARDFEAIPTDPIVDALDYYKTGKYNSGWKGQYPAVLREYNEVTNNPQLMLIINDAKNTKSTGGQLNNIILDTNSYGGGGLTEAINIPAAVSGLWNRVKKRLYRTITPEGYHLARAAKEFISGKNRDTNKFTPAENEVWARYLGVPYEGESSFEKAIYTPTLGGATYDDVIKFKDESKVLSDDALRQLLQNQMLTGKNSMLIEGNESGLGTYTLSLGEDKNGKYISYYDDWDINPTRGISAKYKVPLIELFGDIVPGSHPFTVYGRRYYTDEDLRKVVEK